jgi:hypothetical protein
MTGWPPRPSDSHPCESCPEIPAEPRLAAVSTTRKPLELRQYEGLPGLISIDNAMTTGVPYESSRKLVDVYYVHPKTPAIYIKGYSMYGVCSLRTNLLNRTHKMYEASKQYYGQTINSLYAV